MPKYPTLIKIGFLQLSPISTFRHNLLLLLQLLRSGFQLLCSRSDNLIGDKAVLVDDNIFLLFLQSIGKRRCLSGEGDELGELSG